MGDPVSDQVVLANANCRVVGRHHALGVLMANKFDTYIFWKTLQWKPFNWNIVKDVASIGEDGVVARETTAFVFLWRIIVDAEGAAFVATSTGIDLRFTLVYALCTVMPLESIRTFVITWTAEEHWFVLLCHSKSNDEI